MRHPGEGTLRRLVDEPAGVADADRAHVAACPACLAGLAAAQRDAELVGAALSAGPGEADTDGAWRRLAAAAEAGTASGAVPGAVSGNRWRTAASRPVVAVVSVLALLTGGGVAAASDWLQIFRTERVAPLTLAAAELVGLPDLSAYGDFRVTQEPRVREVAGEAAAAREIDGFAVPRVRDLPRGVTGDPTYRVGDRMTAVFTFSAEKAAATAADSGEAFPEPPAGLDGARFRLVAGPGVAAVWSSRQGFPALVVARATGPTAYSTGVDFGTARDYLLSLPGMPEDLAGRLRAIDGDGTVLPLPLNADELSSSEADVNGEPATLVTSRDGALAGVVWVSDGVVTAVAGSLSTDEVLTVARKLQAR